jgi:ribonuclease HII
VGWIIGIDEAGYGPNLGPFVMTAVACQVPPTARSIDLWDCLRAAVRRAGEAEDGRILVADSKVVYSTARGLLGLERGFLATLGRTPGATLGHLLEHACPDDHPSLRAERWYRGTHPLPAQTSMEDIEVLANRFSDTCATAGVGCWRVASTVICPPHFNELTQAAGTKGAVLGHAVIRLMRGMCDTLSGNLLFFVDKHGGRNTYAALIQHALRGGAVVVREEGMARSSYEALGLGREVHLTFQPRAEAACFCVALASMASKYLRELLMCEFNHFWQEHVPDLKPTAGYPGDAGRFLAAIRPAMEKLGIHEAELWRRK